jgi:hypothetical protein
VLLDPHALASTLPSLGHHATFTTCSPNCHFRTHLPLETSHIRNVPSALPESNHLPVWQIEIESTLSECPTYFSALEFGYGLNSFGDGSGGSISFGLMLILFFATRGHR